MKNIRKLILVLLRNSNIFRKIVSFFFPRNVNLKMEIFQINYLEQMIHSYYDKESISNKLFYNIGAGNQRSKFGFWKYIDLSTSKYSKDAIDIFYDLESLSQLPLPNDHAEVIFNSFVIEHISVEATKNLCKEAFRVLKKGGVFHSKVHSYEYAAQLLNKNIISPKVPYGCRESAEKVRMFMQENKNKVKSYFNKNNENFNFSTALSQTLF